MSKSKFLQLPFFWFVLMALIFNLVLLGNQFYFKQDLSNQIILIVSTLLLTVTLFNYFRVIILPLMKLTQKVKLAAKGELQLKEETERWPAFLQDLHDHLNRIIENQLRATVFAGAIGEGKNSDFKPLSENDKLGHALVTMQQALEKAGAIEKKHNWAMAGLTLLGDLLREQNQDLRSLGDKILSQLIKYLKANQGRIYLVKEEDGEKYLEMVSCYAWDKKKFIEQKIEMGNGLAGQCWLEAEPIYLTKVPSDYVKITSGLGMATPSTIFIVPLKINDEVHGIMELASFTLLEPHERNFILKAAESIASTLSGFKTAENTRTLLEQSRRQAEQLKSNEEVLHQSMEELKVTKEEMERSGIELQEQLKQVLAERRKSQAILEGCVDGVISFLNTGEVQFFNRAAEEILGFSRREVIMKPIAQLMEIHVEGSAKNKMRLLSATGEEIGVRTEITTTDKNGNEISLLLTATKIVLEEGVLFTLFAQRISVEMF
jgi:PAS domain S-box-containing protein